MLWIAREKNGILYLFNKKPIYNGFHWILNKYQNQNKLGAVSVAIINDEYDNVTFENSPKKLVIDNE